MEIERVVKIRCVLADIARDMQADAINFDGRPFSGKTVAEYFGNQGRSYRGAR